MTASVKEMNNNNDKLAKHDFTTSIMRTFQDKFSSKLTSNAFQFLTLSMDPLYTVNLYALMSERLCWSYVLFVANNIDLVLSRLKIIFLLLAYCNISCIIFLSFEVF